MTSVEAKEKVLRRISPGTPVSSVGRSKYRVGTRIVHVRWRSSAKNGRIFSYNINPNTLQADYELWICGSDDVYYLFPTEVMKLIYQDPDAYVDYQHPEIRVAEVDSGDHRLLFGRGGKSMDASEYFCGHLRG